jgi:enoyl-CoA hydratase
MPGWGLSQKLSRAIGISRAKELSLTGNFLDAATAERWGLVNRVVSPAELLPVTRALARDMLSVPDRALRSYKKIIDTGFAQSFGESLATERSLSGAANRAVTADSVESARKDVRARGQTQVRSERP